MILLCTKMNHVGRTKIIAHHTRAGALLAQAVKKAEVIAFEGLGPEAIYRLEVEHFPVIVINDVHGHDLYVQGVKKYKRQ